MALHAVRTTDTLSYEAIAERIQVYVDRATHPYIAAQRVIEDLCREGRQADLLDLFGPPALMEAWEQARRPTRVPMPMGQRRVRLDALGSGDSILESLQYVNDRWVRVGDMTRDACRKAARSLKKDALATAQRARFFHALSERLADRQTVRDGFDDAALARLMTEVGK